MNNHTIRTPEEIYQDVARKLQHASISDEFRAILGCLLGEGWTTPRLVEMFITPECLVLGRSEDLDYAGKLLGTTTGLLQNIKGLAKLAELDGDEIGYLVAKVVELKRRKPAT